MTFEIEIPETASIHEAENIAFEKMQATGRDLLLKFICEKSKTLRPAGLRLKDTARRYLETRFGVIHFERQKFHDPKKRRSISPLLAALGLSPRQASTDGLTRAGIELAVEKSYGYAAQKLTALTGVLRGKTTIWQDVQKLGQAVAEREDAEIDNLFSGGEIKPEPVEKPDTVAIEIDETMIHARDSTKSEKHMPRIAMVYTAKKRRGKKYALHNKRLVARIEHPSDFGRRLFWTTSKYYQHQQANTVVIRSDGANWIRNIREEHYSSALWQTDPWHVIDKIKMLKLPDRLEQRLIDHTMHGKPQLLSKNLWQLCTIAKSTDIQKLAQYVDRNKDGLYPLPQLADPKLTRAERSMFVRGSGAMERNVGLLVTDRMKNQRMIWSLRGANNLLALRCLKYSGKKAWQKIWQQ
ncbi:MAG: UPF0236 family protein [Candidatus Margulisbacteria bacterium]|jgi:hypothetical protein|nr:UPF0236 family protein [Candidatus Margulisiibacteriota bacterium]